MTTTPKKIVIIIFVILFIIFASFGAVAWYVWHRVQSDFGITSTTVQKLLNDDLSSIKRENDRVNIAILGQGGKDHESGDLTDSMLILSLNLNTHDQVLISIPRDLWSDDLKDRINTAYYYAEEKETGSGLEASKKALSAVIGVPIQYAVRVDFEGFSELIDIVGGVDVAIDESFTDTEFPIKGKENDLCDGDTAFKCRYEEISFTKGVEHMNGDRALKYVRSRHASGESGTDFSRGKRQQAVIDALIQKLIKNGANWDTLRQLWQKGHELIHTDLTEDDELILAKFVAFSPTHMRSIALAEDDPATNSKGLLMNPPVYQYGGRWVLIPKGDTYETVHSYISCELKEQADCKSLIK